MIGLLMLQLARLAGAAKVALLEPIESKREVGKELGADICIDPIHENVKAKLKEHGMTWVNTVIECVGRRLRLRRQLKSRVRSGRYDVWSDKTGGRNCNKAI